MDGAAFQLAVGLGGLLQGHGLVRAQAEPAVGQQGDGLIQGAGSTAGRGLRQRDAEVGGGRLGQGDDPLGSAGQAEYAVASTWTRKPDTVSWIDAAALPSSAEAAVGVLRQLNVTSGETLLLPTAGGTGLALVELLGPLAGKTVLVKAAGISPTDLALRAGYLKAAGRPKPYRQSTPTPPRSTPTPRRALPGTPEAGQPLSRHRFVGTQNNPDRDGQRLGPRCATATQIGSGGHADAGDFRPAGLLGRCQ